MTRRWPYHFPMGTKDGYKLSPIDKVMRSDMEVGAPRVRKTTTANIDRLNISWRFTDVQMAAFRAWFDDLPWSLSGESDGTFSANPFNVSINSGVIQGLESQATSRIIENTATNQHNVGRAIAAPDNAVVLQRATIRPAGRTFVSLNFITKTALNRFATFDLTSGSVTATSGTMDESVEVLDGGWVRIWATASISAGVGTASTRLGIRTDATTFNYLGDGVSGIDVTDYQVRVVNGYDLFLPTSATGAAKGANGGSAWFAMPVALGNGGIERREVRFIGTYAVSALPGFNWEVSANLEVRNA